MNISQLQGALERLGNSQGLADDGKQAVSVVRNIVGTLRAGLALNNSSQANDMAELIVKLIQDADRAKALDTALAGMSNHDLASQLRGRGAVASVWDVDDLEFLDEHEDTQGLNDAQLDELKKALIGVAYRGLENALSSRGNDYLEEIWESKKAQLLADVQSAKGTPERMGG